MPALGRAMSFATSSEWDDGGAESSLPDDVVRRVLRHVHPAHLNTCAAVCRRWRRCVADLRRLELFRRRWNLAEVTGEPRSIVAFVDKARIGSFVRERPVRPTDTLASIAVRHGITPGEVKRANGLLSEFSLHSRTSYLVPVASPDEIIGASAHLTFHEPSSREVALLSPGDADGDGDGDGADGVVARNPADAAKLAQRAVVSLARVVGTDVDTARFYLEEAEGDVRAAHAAFLADESWDEKTIDAAGTGTGTGMGTRVSGGGEGVFDILLRGVRGPPVTARYEPLEDGIELTEKKDQ